MSCRYTLVLRYGTNKFYLAPRFSIDVVETSGDFESLSDSSKGCSTCGSNPDRTWHFKAHFVGGCSLASAWSLYNALQAFLDAGCSAGDLTIERTVCDEAPLVYQIKKADVRMIDVINQYIKQRVLTMDITLSLTAWVETGEGAVLVGA